MFEYEKVLLFLILGCLGTSFENERFMVNLYLIGFFLNKYRSDLDFDALSYCDKLTISNQVWGSGSILKIRERRGMFLIKIVVDLLLLCNNRRENLQGMVRRGNRVLRATGNHT